MQPPESNPVPLNKAANPSVGETAELIEYQNVPLGMVLAETGDSVNGQKHLSEIVEIDSAMLSERKHRLQ